MPVQKSKRSQDIQPFHVMALLARARELEAQGKDIVHMEIGAASGLPEYLNSLPILGPIVSLMLLGTVFVTVQGWRNGQRSRLGAILSVVGLLFIWYLGYWHLLAT